MIISVDTTARPAVVELDDPDDCGSFHLAVTGNDVAAVRQALEVAALGTLVDRGAAVVSVDAVRRMVQGRVGDDWPQRFTAMLAYAGTEGWLTDDGGGIRAHTEWD